MVVKSWPIDEFIQPISLQSNIRNIWKELVTNMQQHCASSCFQNQINQFGRDITLETYGVLYNIFIIFGHQITESSLMEKPYQKRFLTPLRNSSPLSDNSRP